MYQSVLVNHAAARRYRPGDQDFTLHVLSSVHSDAGLANVILERQGDPAMCQARSETVLARLAASWRRLVAGSRVAASRRPQAIDAVEQMPQ